MGLSPLGASGGAIWLPEAPQITLVQWSLRFPFRRRRSPAPIPIWRAAFGRRAPHFRLPLPVISATAPGVFAARRVWCRTISCRNTHFHFPVWMGDFAMVPGAFSALPVPVRDSPRGVLTLRASWISCQQCFVANCVLISSSNYFTAGPRRSASSSHEAMTLSFVFRAL